MMRAARKAAEKQASELGIPKPTLLGVTVLTSIDEANFQRDFETPRRLVDQVAYPRRTIPTGGVGWRGCLTVGD